MKNDGIESDNFNGVQYAEQLLSDPSTLEGLRDYLNYTSAYKASLDQQIQQRVQEHNEYLRSEKRFQPSEAREKLNRVFDEINSNKKLSANTQNVITGMASSIKKLDEAKKNLVLTMTVLRRLQMLFTAFEQLESLTHEKRYQESVQLLSAVLELVNHFKSYKTIDEIAEIMRKVSKLKITLADQIFQDFELALSHKESIKDSELLSGCLILQTIGQSYQDRLINWFSNQQLKEIKTIFASSDEAGSLENISRRFIFFKRVLKNYDQYYKGYFPEGWNLEEELTTRFCTMTKESIKQVLSDSGKDTNVDLMLNSLQQTLDFEKFLDDKYRQKLLASGTTSTASLSSNDGLVDHDSETLKFSQSISSAFEPFLGFWVEHQNSFLSDRFLEFLSAPKIPSKEGEEHQANVIPSSADLFRAYRHLLTQCATLSTAAPLRDLSKLFAKWLLEYSNRILKPTLPLVATNEESFEYITLVLNTCDYCSTTITQLEERLVEIIDEPYKKEINFEQVRESFIMLINKSLKLLLNKIETECEFAWREMANTNWAHMEDVGDQSRYIASLREIIATNCKQILPKFARDVYARSFCDKIVETITNEFLNSIIRTRPIPVIAAEQMLLDLSVLKDTFLQLPKYSKKDEEKISTQYQKHVERIVNKLFIILKVLLTQDAPQEGLVSNYFYLIGDKSTDNFLKILKLKGITDKNRQTKFLDLFRIHMKAHDNLVESSPVLSKIKIESLPQALPSSTGILTNNSRVGSPEISSPKFENLFSKKENLEKGLKELTTNGEVGVSSLKTSFGRFFKSHNNDD